VFGPTTSARWSEAKRAELAHVLQRGGGTFVQLQGTKTKRSKREVPILGSAGVLLAWALGRPIFPSWPNVRRDLHAACKRAGIPPCSPNDLRRTFSTWMQQAGAGNDLIAQAMGHVDSRMVERVYGRMQPDDLARLLEQRTGQARAELPQTPAVAPAQLPAPTLGVAPEAVGGPLALPEGAALPSGPLQAPDEAAPEPPKGGRLMATDSVGTGPFESASANRPTHETPAKEGVSSCPETESLVPVRSPLAEYRNDR
jgi:hypothetical protein